MAVKRWTAVIAVAGLLLAATGSSVFAQRALTVRAADQEGYARLVFEGAGNLIDETRIAGDTLYIRFREPVQLDTGEPVRVLGSYISSAALSRGGSVLSLRLRKSILLRTSDLGDAAMVDLIETVGALSEGTPITVRVGEHPTFDRVVFDWPRRVDYRLQQVGRSVEITFDAGALPDFSRLYADTPPTIRSAEVEPEGEGVKVTLHLTGPADVTSFRDGPRIAIDLHPRAADPDLPAGHSEPAPAPQAAEAEAASPAPPPAPTEPVSETAPTMDAGKPAEAVTVEVSAIASGTRLRLPLETRAPAAVFSRAGYLWLVLGGAYDIDHSALADAGEPLAGDAEVIRLEDATVLRVAMDPAFQVISRRLNESWEVDLTLYPAAPLTPLQVARHEHETLGPIVFISVEDAPAFFETDDPEVGDRLVIVPLLANGNGLMEERRFSEFTLLKTAQGIAIQLTGDSTEVTRFDNGIAISGGRGLGFGAASPVQKSAHAPPFAAPREFVPFVDLAAWRRGSAEEYQSIRAELMQRLAMADESNRNERRFDLARFYLANSLWAEAGGYLALMWQDEPSLDRDPHFLAVRGIAAYGMGRLEAADEDLAHPDLEGDPHISLFRAAVSAGLKNWREAHDFYRDGLKVLSAYDEPARARFQLAAVQAARALGDMETARRELMVLSSYDLPRSQSSQVKLLIGELYEEEGVSDKALAAYDDAIAEDYRPTRVRAEFNRVAELVERDAISREEAISELERLRYVWRGDDLELKALRLLGRLYMEAGNHREALSRMRSAVTQFNGTDEARQVAREMGNIFRTLYLEGGTDNLPPIRALALYYDFRELTPIGFEGDQMIRRLADRLVKVDLLDKAAELLEHQVTFRLEGAAKAQVAENLAVVYLLDHLPEKALDAIRDSEQPQLPEEITRRRRHLEARALTDLNRFEEAEELLRGDQSPEAMALKADLHWQAENWGQAARASRAVLDHQMSAGRGGDYTQILRLAVATSLSGDNGELPRLAAEFGTLMKAGPYARTFDLITSDTPTSGNELRDIIDSVADVSSFETYLASYKNELSTAAVRP